MKPSGFEESYRFQSDRRQYGGMLQLLGFCASKLIVTRCFHSKEFFLRGIHTSSFLVMFRFENTLVIQPLGNLVSAFGPEGAITTDASEIPFWGMVGAFCLFITGIVAVLTGYMANVHDFSHRHITTFLMIIIQVR